MIRKCHNHTLKTYLRYHHERATEHLWYSNLSLARSIDFASLQIKGLNSADKCHVSKSSKLLSLLRQGLSEPDFYGDLVYKLKKIVGSNNFSAQFIKIISHYKKIGYNINVLQQTACLVVNPITVGNFAFLFNCTPVGRTSDSMMVPT